SISSLGIDGNSLAAVAAAFGLRGIHAPLRHVMPYTQNFGQAHAQWLIVIKKTSNTKPAKTWKAATRH
ncbi:hypothetical protein, partial [Caballeronia sp. 15711]|uniref:hypothetical protein n=1 Tax=Caballeronia sp. 15711 TaxID=3391029 RepID=UPI0039E4D47E